MALDNEAFVGRAHPASLDHRLRGTRLPPGERGQVLRKVVGLAERHLAAGALLGGAALGRCRSLLPLGAAYARGFRLARTSRRAAKSCCTRCAWRPQQSDHFLMNYFLRPLEGGPPLLPYARRPPRAPGPASRSRRRSAAALPERVAARMTRSAWSMGRRRVSSARAWAGASAAAAKLAMTATLAIWGARAAP